MTTKITKPEIDIRSKLNELDKPSGVAGEAMLRAETPEEQRRLIGLGQRNMIINGDFQVWQRGTSGTSGFVADRWRGFSTTSQSKHYDSEVGNYLRFTSTNPALIYYGIELPETGQVTPFEVGETYTISLKVKSEGVMFKPNCSFRDGLGGGTNTVFSAREIKPHKGTGEWEDVVYQFTVDAAPHSTAKLFELTIVSWDYSNTSFDIAQVQMVKGKVATPFEHRTYAEELALCQRYCYVVGDSSQVTYLGSGSMYTTTAANVSLPLPVQLRDNNPSITRVPNGSSQWLNVYVGASGHISNATPLQGDYTQSNMRLYIPGAHSGTNSFVGAGIWCMVVAGAKLIIDAEL